jgi:hypothetical protein
MGDREFIGDAWMAYLSARKRFCRKLFLAVDWDMIAGNDPSGTAR